MPHQLAETIQELRGTAMRGLVVDIYDSGAVQLVDVQTHDGMTRTGIEVYQQYGFATAAPMVGSVVQLVAIGADPGDLVAMPPICPAARFGNLAQGEVVVYDQGGQRLALRQGGRVDVLAGATINIAAPHVVITAPFGCVINGPVTINGTLNVTGDVLAGAGEDNISLLHHVHGGVIPGGGNTGEPDG